MRRGRPVGSAIRQNIIELLAVLGKEYGYAIAKKYLEIFPASSTLTSAHPVVLPALPTCFTSAMSAMLTQNSPARTTLTSHCVAETPPEKTPSATQPLATTSSISLMLPMHTLSYLSKRTTISKHLLQLTLIHFSAPTTPLSAAVQSIKLAW